MRPENAQGLASFFPETVWQGKSRRELRGSLANLLLQAGWSFTANTNWYWIGTYRIRERLAFNIRSSSTPIPTQGRLTFTSGLSWATRIFTGPAKTLPRSTRQTRDVLVANSLPTGPAGLTEKGHNVVTTPAHNA